MSIISFVANNTIWIALAMIILFMLYKIFLAPRPREKDEEEEKK